MGLLDFWYILIVAMMFAPSIFIFYNSSAWVYKGKLDMLKLHILGNFNS